VIAADPAVTAADPAVIAADPAVIAADPAVIAADSAVIAAGSAVIAAGSAVIAAGSAVIAADGAARLSSVLLHPSRIEDRLPKQASEKHPSRETTTKHTETHRMPARKKPVATAPLIGQAPTTPTLTSTPTMPVPILSTATAPVTTSSPVVVPAPPSVASIPSAPATFVPIDLTEFRGSHAKKAQIAAVAGVLTELADPTTYAQQLGPYAIAAGSFTQVLSTAGGWSNVRIALEAYLLYAKTQEGIAWRAALTDIDQLKAVFDVAATRNPDLARQLPALARLLGVTGQVTQKAVATKKRNKAEAVAKATTAATARVDATPSAAAPAATSSAPSTASSATATGGAAH